MNKNIGSAIILMIALFSPKINSGQNLVQNASFEDHNACSVFMPTWDAEGSLGVFPNEPTVNKWYKAGQGTADYYNTCSGDWRTQVPTNLVGTQTPHTGNAYAGLITFSADSTYKEYLENQLSSPLVAGHQYTVSFWISRPGPTWLITNSTAVHFSNTPYVNIPNQGFLASSDVSSPVMISNNAWTQVQGVYTAVGGEQWITIGNFLPAYQTQVQLPQPIAAPTTYYYFDDVSVVEIQKSINDTLFLCSSNGTLTSGGSAAFSYTVLNGNATLTGNGPSYTVTASTLSKVLLHSTSNTGSNITDTFLVVPAPNVDAGLPQTISGCGIFNGTLNGSISNATSWINYAIAWSPAASITTGPATLSPSISPTQNTTYKLTVSTDNMHGNCNISDSVMVIIDNHATISNFTYAIKKGCLADSVVFTNQSQNALAYSWDFNDGSIADTSKNPIHVFNTQGIYNVKLTTNNGGCTSNITKSIDTRHPLVAAFNVNKDVICQGSTVIFTNTSTVSTPPASYLWHWGDGMQSNAFNATHTYSNSGTYNAMLVVSDAIPCFDTTWRTITVDGIADVRLQQSRNSICTGESVDFNAVSNSGDSKFIWDFNDGSVALQTPETTHAYDHAGKFKVELTAQFRVCPDIVLADTVSVYALPVVNLGTDTALCLDGKAIPISNLEPPQSGDQFVWNTGETTPATLIKHPGVYKLTVTNAAGCSATDELDVKKDCYIDIPNSFTPNNDGVNDYFFPRQQLSQGLTGFTMQVFDRWGEKIFETMQPNGRGWDGKFNSKDQPQGVYIYIINVVLKNGRTEHYTGNVTLLR